MSGALGILFCGPVVHVAAAAAIHGLSATSLEPVWRPELLGPPLLVHGVQLTLFFSFGLALSFLRRFSWLVAGVVVLVFGLLVDHVAAFGVLDPLELVRPVYRGASLEVPWNLLTLQLGLAAALLALAAWLFRGRRGERVLLTLGRLPRWRAGRVALGLGGCAIFAVWTALFVWLMVRDDRSEEESGSDGTFSAWNAEVALTTFYRMSYPGDLRHRAEVLLEKADAVHEAVRLFLAAEPLGILAVDATVELGRHELAGQASWKSIRISMRDLEDPEDLLATFAHETVHVYAAASSDQRLGEHFRFTRFFNEGLATFVEQSLAATESRREVSRLLAAAAWKRERVRLEDLIDDELLVEDFDRNLVYPLGEVFVAALVESCGTAAPARVLRSLARPQLEDVEGAELWRHVLQGAGCDFDSAVNAWWRLLEEAWEENRESLEGLPALRAEVELTEEEAILRVPEAGSDLYLTCRFRPRADVASSRTERVWQLEDDSLRTDLEDWPAGGFDYQLGLYLPGGDEILWGRWWRVDLGS